MATSYSPKIITDGLVFMYDTDDGKSYKGEPTTNLLNHTTEFNNWIAAKNSGTAPTVTADTSVNPLGLVNAPMADKVYIPDDGTYPRIQQYFTPSSTNTHTFSVWIRSLSGNCDCFLGAFRNSPWSLPGSSVKSITGEWQRFTFSWTPPDTTTHLIYMGSHDTAAQKGNTLEFWGAQMEAKSHATQFTTGTRSATQGLLDRTGTSTIDISNASFDSDAQMVFDGTDDYADVSATDLFQPQNTTDGFTVEYVYRPEANTSAVPVGNLSSTNGWFQAPISNSSLGAYLYFSTDGVVLSTDSSYAINSGIIGKYQHIVMVLKWSDTVNSFIMVNGEDKTASKATASKYTVSGSANPALRIGKRGGSIWPANGQIPLIKIYNRALTAAEVLQNYNATKGRFGL